MKIPRVGGFLDTARNGDADDGDDDDHYYYYYYLDYFLLM